MPEPCRERLYPPVLPVWRSDGLRQSSAILAPEADRHEISRASYDHRIALSERVVSREEDRRNRLAHTDSSYQSTPFTPVVATLSRIFN